jgi:hypothetical protein
MQLFVSLTCPVLLLGGTESGLGVRPQGIAQVLASKPSLASNSPCDLVQTFDHLQVLFLSERRVGSGHPQNLWISVYHTDSMAGSLLSTQKEMDLSFRRKNLI